MKQKPQSALTPNSGVNDVHARLFLKAIVESSDDPIIAARPDGVVTAWNSAASRVFGYSASEMAGRSIMTIVPEHRAAEFADFLARVALADAPCQIETIHRAKSGREVAVWLTASPVRDETSLALVGVTMIVRDLSSHQASLDALRDSEGRHRAVIETAVDGIITIDEGGVIESLNPAAERLFGSPACELIGRNISVLMPSPYKEQHKGYLERYLGTGERRIIGIGREVVGLRKDGSEFPMDLAVSELRLKGRRMFTGLVRDITERKRAEQRQRLLADELDHRVKNNLAAVLSLATQTISTSSSLEEFSTAFTGRLRTMAQTHTALAHSKWEGVCLQEIADLVLGPYRSDDGERVRIDGPALRLPARAATPVAMTLHELATNAVKYGALSVPDGSLRLAWSVSDESTIIEWKEQGGPPVATPERFGSGTLIMEGLIRYEIRGAIDLRYDRDGVKCTIVVPDSAGQATGFGA